MTASAERTWLLAIVVGGLLLRLAAVIVLHIAPEADYLEYQTMALNLVSGRGLVDSTHNLAFYNAGYPLLVVAPMFWLFGSSLLPVQLVNACLSTVAIPCSVAVARAVGAGPLGRLAAAASVAFYVPALVYSEYLAKENLMTPALIGVVWCALRFSQGASMRVALLCGGLFGLLALTGNSALALVPVVAIGLWMGNAPLRHKLALGMVIAGIAVAIMTPWLLRNARVLGAPALNTNGGFNLYLGNNPRATGVFMSIADTPRGPTWQALRAQGELYASQTLKAEAVEWMRTHPWDVLRLSVVKLGLFWTPPVHEGQGPGSTAETLIRRVWLAQFALLVLAALMSVAWSTGRSRYVGLVWLSIAAFTGVHMLFYVSVRYREPMMPLVGILAALAVERLLELRLLPRRHDIPREA